MMQKMQKYLFEAQVKVQSYRTVFVLLLLMS